ncbi:MAG TPA: 3-methyl-2-oxobutanoate hydroxymethyltransferase [Aggregatilineales bacterium]|nr:3-methyl-2-oxobutanoate hydroxymethyltransferase [Aggregatilineales bacterium]
MDKVTLHKLRDMKQRGERITMLTAYDYPTALLMDEAGVDMLLVGDSLGMVVHGFESTLPVTMDMMLMHCQAVRRGAKRALVVGDMPFMSFQLSREDALRNAARFLSEGGVDAVKLEGGRRMADTVRAMVETGIAVQGHIGLTPQSVSAFGGMRVQGRSVEAARSLLDDARALEDAGAFSIVLEGIPARLAALITARTGVPTIGIGAGAGCDGQVLVSHDMLGLYERFTPKFVRRYATLAESIRGAVAAYCDDVRSGAFPAEEETYAVSDEVWAAIEERLDAES